MTRRPERFSGAYRGRKHTPERYSPESGGRPRSATACGNKKREVGMTPMRNQPLHRSRLRRLQHCSQRSASGSARQPQRSSPDDVLKITIPAAISGRAGARGVRALWGPCPSGCGSEEFASWQHDPEQPRCCTAVEAGCARSSRSHPDQAHSSEAVPPMSRGHLTDVNHEGLAVGGWVRLANRLGGPGGGRENERVRGEEIRDIRERCRPVKQVRELHHCFAPLNADQPVIAQPGSVLVVIAHPSRQGRPPRRQRLSDSVRYQMLQLRRTPPRISRVYIISRPQSKRRVPELQLLFGQLPRLEDKPRRRTHKLRTCHFCSLLVTGFNRKQRHIHLMTH